MEQEQPPSQSPSSQLKVKKSPDHSFSDTELKSKRIVLRSISVILIVAIGVLVYLIVRKLM
jgi:hypothetical protein